jgi:TonB-linked SusC/RagA family outer membrane protein
MSAKAGFRESIPGWLRARSLLLVFVGAMCCVWAPESLLAQEAVVAGTVTDARTQRPLTGAQVVIVGRQRGTITDRAGRFRITGLTGQTVQVQVVMLGYRTTTRTVSVGDANVQMPLEESALELDELVVTGTAGAVQKRALGNTVTKIDAAQVVASSPIPDAASLINGRAPGVVIQPGTGMIGSGPRVRIRGTNSFSLNDQPLIYVDGVRTNNEVSSGITIQAFGSSVISRLNDINPDDIESIEIIKGPAAATLYGTEAANGVIQIITKKGRPGDRPIFNFTVRQGTSWFMDPEGRIPTTWARNPTTNEIFEFNIVENENEGGAGRALCEQNIATSITSGITCGPIFKNGHTQGYSGNVSGGSDVVRYYIGLDYDRQEGIEPVNDLWRFSSRANVSVAPNSQLDITASLGVTNSKTNLALEAGAGGIWFSTMFNNPNLRETPRRGFLFNPPEAIWNYIDELQEVSRVTGSLLINHKPARWFTHRLTVGLDLTNENDEELVERLVDPYQFNFFVGDAQLGSKFERRRGITYHTVDYSGTVDAGLTANIDSRTSLGAQYYRKFIDVASAFGRQFPTPDLKTISATAITTGFDDYVENATVGVFGQQQFSWKDRLFVTGALRADDNSAFGEDFDLVYYPKFSVSWVLNEESFFRVPLLSTFKLRGAYGQSGQQPDNFAALRTYQPITTGTGTPAVTAQFLGNPALGPERSAEIELGFEAGLLRERFGIDFTYYTQRTEDAILLKDVAPSFGFPGNIFVNAGEIRNKGIELQVKALAVQRRNFDVDLVFNLSSNSNKVVKLTGDPAPECSGPERFRTSSCFITLGSQRHQIGYPVGAWFRERVLTARFDAATGRATAELCDDGFGGSTPCLDAAGNLIAPRIFLGPASAKWEGSFSPAITLFERLRLNGLIDFKRGHKHFDNNLRARCQIFFICRENMYPQEYDPALIAEMQSNARFVAFVINDASFARLREISASYNVPDAWAGQVGARRAAISVAARNLHTWTNWTGLDPESYFLVNLHARLEQDNTPQLAQFITTINFSF